MSVANQEAGLIVVPRYNGHSQASLQELFADTNSGEFIQKNVVIDTANQVDLTATAARIGAVIEDTARPVYGSLGVKDGKWLISTRLGLDPASKQYVFGHELGHVVLLNYFLDFGTQELKAYGDRCAFEPAYFQYTEAFCDYFAGRILDAVYPNTLPIRTARQSLVPVRQLSLEVEW